MYIIGIIVILSLIGGLFVVAPLWIYFISKNVNNKLNNLENIKKQIEINQEKLNQKITELSNNKVLSPQDKTLLQIEINSIQTELNQQQTDLSQIQFSLGKLKIKNFKKTNPKKIIIIYYGIVLSIFAIFGGFIFLDNKYDITNSKPKIYPIPDKTTEVKEEYFYGHQIHERYPIDKKYPIPSNEKPYLGADGKTWYLYKNSTETLKGIPMIVIKYTFYGLDGLGKGQHQEYEPTDIPPFYKNPFNKWKYKNDQIDYFETFSDQRKREDSQFIVSLIPRTTNHTLEIQYKGPKWLFEEDKDFYIDEFKCDEFESIENFDGKIRYKNYYLHFNPVKQYITLYTKKFNTKNDENK
ncbi:FlxA-like family protein [Paulownia witches'-broom phytoplasma]|uniref:FlxA-like family protein n=1 Tax=Paulownia witches'-broom phytoplasma TaxID=39647 RepID=A0ABX8TRT2_9MOLU|nr:hypothetical protein [Paulownia witches'-broom phytoplasma]QYC31220.1 FlxA-like family protein [Paulownia witches'-broom phytoplasma]